MTVCDKGDFLVDLIGFALDRKYSVNIMQKIFQYTFLKMNKIISLGLI